MAGLSQPLAGQPSRLPSAQAFTGLSQLRDAGTGGTAVPSEFYVGVCRFSFAFVKMSQAASPWSHNHRLEENLDSSAFRQA